jgi:hypothetical protein
MVSRLCYLDAYDRAVAVRRPVPLLRLPGVGHTHITIFDLFQVLAMGGGLWFGVKTGDRGFGAAGAVVGGVLGLVVGHFVGVGPIHFFWVVFRLLDKLTPTEMLRKKLLTEHYIAYRLIAEMIVRGEPAESFWPFVLSALQSDSFYERYHGWENLNLWFPRIAQQIEGFDPNAPTERCRKYVTKIENVEPSAAPLPCASDAATPSSAK